MIKSFAFISCLVFFIARGCSQSCLPNGIVFNRQTQIDSFPVLYSDCFTIEGNVRVEGDDIVKLDSLLLVQSILGSFVIINNPNLLNLHGLTSLESVQGDFLINNNDNLVDLSGLEQFHIALGDLLISENDNLLRPGSLLLDTILGTLFLDDNASLIDFFGFDSLNYIGGDLLISNNIHLTTFSGIDSLHYIGDHLELVNNPGLNNIDALDHVHNAPWELLAIDNCKQLSDCAVNSICNHFIAEGATHIVNNGPGCNSREEIESACTVATQNPLANENISIYPNPTYDQIEINASNFTPKSFSFCDPCGKLLKTWPSDFQSLDLSEFPAGIYFLYIEFDDQSVNRKIIKL